MERDVQLRVTDLERSTRFYTEIAGLREHTRSSREVILTCRTWFLGLVASVRRGSHNPPREPYDVARAGLHHLAFALGSAAEVDAAAVWLDTNHVPRKPVSDGFTPGSRFVTFYDPDGIPLEYCYWDAAYADVYGVEVDVRV
jgi:catechol 2,3-dioxygenase-like lactoylglutathione lyase family enzyme